MTTILFVPGAWISKAFYEPFLQALTDADYDVHYASYPSFDPKNPSTTDCHTDTEAIRAILNSLVDEGKDVLLFLHSYAGMPGAAAATGLAKGQRAQEGKLGGVIGLLFLGAFVVPEGLSCASLQGGNLPPWILLDQVRGVPSIAMMKMNNDPDQQPSANLNIPDDPVNNFAAEIDSALAQSPVPHRECQSACDLGFHIIPASSSLGR